MDFPLKRRHDDVRGGRDLLQDVRGSLTDPRILSATL